MDCAVCRVNDEARAAWGCDRDLDEPILIFECWNCKGLDEDCATCGGSNRVGLPRCPRAIVDPQAQLAVAMVALLEVGSFPVAGGFLDQAATFVDAAILLGRERELYRKREEQHRGSTNGER